MDPQALKRDPLAPAALTPLVAPPSMRQDATQQQHSAPPVHLRCSFDEHMSRAYPNHWQPMPQEHIKLALYAMGATDDTLLDYLEILNNRWDEMFARYPNGKPPTYGEKPQLDDGDVLYCRIPDSTLTIRIWSGGMEQYGTYCLDFFDVVERTPVNTPDGYVISYYPHPGVFTFSRELVSWEAAAGIDRISAGMEKYSAPEGSQLVLTRPGKMPYYFQIPRRPSGNGIAFVQPQADVPY